jgi:TPR repeat protein
MLCIVALSTTGCVAAGVEGANIAKDKATISNNLEMAQKGDAVAQFKVGDAYCCSIGETESGFYNTRVSVGWLCASAVQGYGPAMYKIGKIYSGDVVEGVRLARRAASGVAGTSENHPVAYAWLAQAQARGVVDAAKRAQEVWAEMSAGERDDAMRLINAGLGATCRWEDAILSKHRPSR